ncbi:hypothetical protein BT63DRAFT_428817 [Microthyrium microscopicum]|uniref:Mitochondrial cytochrome c oxidase assembly factor n=1 Tax=Microthyrium microscopicum TaxID=703497 RepID=A0A6A6U0S6_9PEZI|nr:hypothetical protein BT63DRAFT_428817 [Microthyrium microscopicum]
MGGPNLEVFKFGIYVLFPIGIMYYFGTNLDQRFSVPDFWPTKEQSNKVPRDFHELDGELERLRLRRLEVRRLRLEQEALDAGNFEEVAKLRTQRFPPQVVGEMGRRIRGREG